MSLKTEQLRALCIKHGIHPNAEGKMPRNAWAALNELNDMLPVDGIWPIARLSIDADGNCTGATLYAPGLPAGEHDVYPAAVEQGSGEPVAFRVVWPIENSVGGRRFYSAEDMAIHRSNVEWLGGKAVPLFDAPQPTPPTPVEKPLFWVRPRSDGGYQGPIHDEVIEEVRCNSGAWFPLYLGAPPTPAPTPALAWEPLTDEQIAKACDKVICINPAAMTTRDIARAIEADIRRRIGAQKGGA